MLTEEQLLLDLDPNVTPQEELRIRLNLELTGDHLATDIPVSSKNRQYWRTVWDAQHQDPVYKPIPLEILDDPVPTDRGLEAVFRVDERTAQQIQSRQVRGLSVGPLDFEP